MGGQVRRVARTVGGRVASEGVGIWLRRTIGGPDLDQVDPLLLLDEFRSERTDESVAGFLDHPERGFVAITYLLAGTLEHKDSRGHFGTLTAGGVRWMTAGSGVVRSETPLATGGLLWGFRLWVNLPAEEKARPPRYQDIPPERVPEVLVGPGARVRVLAGEAAGVEGPVRGITAQPLFLDVALEAGAELHQYVPAEHNAIAYLFEGEASFAPEEGCGLDAGQVAVLAEGRAVTARAGPRGARVLLISARPIGEPVVRYGPFVMNSRQEVLEAIHDFHGGDSAEPAER